MIIVFPKIYAERLPAGGNAIREDKAREDLTEIDNEGETFQILEPVLASA